MYKYFLKNLVIKIIQLYQKTVSFDHGFFKFFYPNGFCRFKPTCSEYAIDAVETHGIIKGGFLSVWRVMRCNPFNKGGYDPIKK
jgi:uncharacterized protein